MQNLISFCGIFVLMLLAWAFSTNRKTVNWRLIIWGLLFQAILGCFIFLLPAGQQFFLLINDLVVKILAPAAAGATFVFGPLGEALGQRSLGFILAFQAMPTVIFFSAIMGVLYYLGIMTRIIKAFAYVFTKFMRVSGAESLCAASNIFVGIESSVTVKSYLAKMTASELCTILTTGMATVASSVVGLYVFTLGKQFPTIAGHVISASFLSAPAALMMSKLVLPETEKPVTMGKSVELCYEREDSLFEAIINGANTGLTLALGIVTLLIAVLGMVELVNVCFAGGVSQFNSFFGTNCDLSVEKILGYLFYPFTLLIGVPFEDASTIASIIGERLINTEVKSYGDLARAIDLGLIKNPRSILIASYALCGFAHFASVAIFSGGIAAIVPTRKKDIARVAFRALLAATLACLMTACIAGVFCNGDLGQSVLGSLGPK
jgi:CNT family concentrative nucleoside transporter